jgi:MFS superfamily sulfate permease-like transporter
MIALLLMFAPTLLQSLPSAALGAVVIAACLSFADLPGMWEMYRLRKVEFGLSVTSFLGVAFVGVIEGIFITIALALLVLVWNAWHPHSAILARVDGAKGYHDISRHPEGRLVPGLVLFRWDAQLFFANAELFREQILNARFQRTHRGPLGRGGIRCDHRCRHHGGRHAADVAWRTSGQRHRALVRRDEGPGEGSAAALRDARHHRA